MITSTFTSGELTGGEALAHPSDAPTVRLRDAAPATTDGPLPERRYLSAKAAGPAL
jgi:hypothetical protein